MAVIGGSESQAVRVSGNLSSRPDLASSRARRRRSTSRRDVRTRRSSGSSRTTASRAPTDRPFVARNLKAKNVVSSTRRTTTRCRSPRPIASGLRGAGVEVARESRLGDDTDFSSIVANVGNDVNVVVFATQVATAANTLSNQLREQGKKAIVFGTDGAYSPSQFKPRSGYVSVFAPDPHFDPKARAIVAALPEVGRRTFGAFGPATYMAGLRRDDGDPQGVRGREGDAREVVEVDAADEHPVDPRRHHPLRREGRPRVAARFVIYRITQREVQPRRLGERVRVNEAARPSGWAARRPWPSL